MRDMIPRGERSIRDVPISEAHRRSRPMPAPQEAPGMPPRRRRRPRHRLFWLFALVIVVVCAVIALLLSTVFAGAKVVVHPQTREVTPPATLEARLSAPLGTLPYEVMTVRRFATTTVAASGTARVSRQASGIITVYNAYGEASQRLIANTRFEAPDGKIYRIRDSVTVPGATKNADGSLKPGSISLTVYADSPGEDYNRDQATRFTIPGFKGDPRYEKFYGQSAGPITGGFVGNEPAVPAGELAKAEAALKLEIETAVRAAAAAEIPEGYLPIAGTLSISYGDMQKVSQGNQAQLSESAMATAAIVREADLAAAIARSALGGEYGGEAVTFLDRTALTVTSVATSSAQGTLTLALSGEPTLLWQFDPALLRDALLGKERSRLGEIIESFNPAITSAEATIRPFWQGSFPDDPEKIEVTIAPPGEKR